jgi:hypothetical protein
MIWESGFSHCRSLKSLTFETGSKLQRIEKWGFSWSCLQSVIVLVSIKTVCKTPFPYAFHIFFHSIFCAFY